MTATSANLLASVNTVTVAATREPFVTVDHFVVNTAAGAPVKISWLGHDFQHWFLGKTEEPIRETNLRCHVLRRKSVDALIIAELGGEAKAETTLAEMFSIMEKQPNGERGALLTSGYVNIFYIKDVNSVLRAVDVGWHGDGWIVLAYPVTDPSGWLDGYQVFSRHS